MVPPSQTTKLVLVLALLAACSKNEVCDAPADVVGRAPARLSETRLYADVGAGELAPGVLPYTPRFELWSDGATKRRWILLPAGARVDTSRMDDWQFPEGTKLWKEFTRDGVRVETRLFWKHGPRAADWTAMAYVWREGDAIAAPEGVVDARGTAHRVPAAGECFACHDGTPSRVLGFSAIQLARAGEPRAGEVDLDDAVRRGMLSAPPAAAPVVPGSPAAQEALGYLHANCGHCHNTRRPADATVRCFDPSASFDFSLRTDRLGSVEETPAYTSGRASLRAPGSAGASRVVDLMSDRPGMPPLGSRVVDDAGVEALRRWVRELGP